MLPLAYFPQCTFILIGLNEGGLHQKVCNCLNNRKKIDLKSTNLFISKTTFGTIIYYQKNEFNLTRYERVHSYFKVLDYQVKLWGCCG